MITTEFIRSFKYSMTVDSQTGEVVEIKCLGAVEDNTPAEAKKPTTRKTTTKKNKDENTTPQLVLEDSKCTFNTAAIELMEIEPGAKIDINYEKYKNGFRPVLSLSDKGCKLTKSGTIACRGSKHDALAEYGTVFEIIKHNEKVDCFILKGDKEEDSTLDDIESELPLDVELPDLVEDDEDLDLEELDSSFFTL